MIAFLRHLFLVDFWWKLFSLVLAILVWLIVTFASQKEVRGGKPVSFMVPVTVLSATEDVRGFRVDPEEVEVTVRGDNELLMAVQSRDIRAIVDLTGVSAAGDLRKPVEVCAPAGVSHLRVTPEEVQVIFPPDR
ncbi:MAG TPA: CdaR family protein [Candidatus Paceibacterota bacterium]|nr:CdaR family protein [Verrucomicrobiota bacterium]HSA12342.1 CdaR family protein [Candidatus Paceibacterota bacterium]